jgi:hypothetical protein
MLRLRNHEVLRYPFVAWSQPITHCFCGDFLGDQGHKNNDLLAWHSQHARLGTDFK